MGSPVIPPPESNVIQDPPQIPNTPNPPPAGKTYTQAELDAKLSAARQEEKDKLYNDLNKSRTKVTELESLLRSNEEKVKDLEKKVADGTTQNQDTETLKSQITDLQKKLDTSNADWTKALDEALVKTRQEFNQTLEGERLATYKQTKIAEAKGKIIPELVTGSTREEIDASFTKATERFNEIYENASKATEKELQKKIKGTLPIPVTPGADGGASGDAADEVTSYRGIPDSEWETKSKEIKQKVFERVGLPMKQ
jgi:hypothetical protein